ncbi:GNAT family N-acetyltransferase [Alcaligenaceae bacterium CGII-47]|nr:GNAT family N-acetyltransferase [Alcaligenaceae bacterium CGII-47]
MPDEKIQVVVGDWSVCGDAAGMIRTEVFVLEQHVPQALELDDQDATCVHAVAYDQLGAAIGTGRLLPDAHIGRMAVRKHWRGQGVGAQLLLALIDVAQQRGEHEVVLSAQLSAQMFYTKYGFQAEGDTYMDAGIEHVLMRRTIP